jgi:hypothetical protein
MRRKLGMHQPLREFPACLTVPVPPCLRTDDGAATLSIMLGGANHA